MTTLPNLDTIVCGDCIAFMDALPAKCVDLVFADPPYNMQLPGDLWRPNETKVDSVDDAWDQFGSFAEYDAFTRAWLSAAQRVLKDDGTLWVIGTYHNIHRVGTVLMDLGYWILNDVVWVKRNPTPQMRGVRFCNAHETLIWAAKSQKTAKPTFNYRGLKAGNEDVQMRSDWHLSLCTGSERETVGGTKAHTTQKPEALLHLILAGTSNPGDVVLDPFCGTGTTATVAKRLGRHFLTVDRDQTYVEVARRRVERTMASLVENDAPWIDAPPTRIPFASLVQAGTIPVGAEMRLLDTDYTAIVMEDGSLISEGVRGSIHRLGAKLRGVPACNGWTSWLHVRGPGTPAILIDVYRRSAAGRAEDEPDGE